MMATVTSKPIVDQIIAGDGYYDDEDPRVVKIVEYTSDWGNTCWGLIYVGEPLDRYDEAGLNPRTLWTARELT
jgi:hypothetical protein